MTASVNSLLHTKFFTPAFDSAIFDGPVRIYFAQYQEPLALKLYFLLRSVEDLGLNENNLEHKDRYIFVMLYPSQENFEMSFEGRFSRNHPIAIDHYEEHIVIGVKQGLQESDFDYIVDAVKAIMLDWQKKPSYEVMYH